VDGAAHFLAGLWIRCQVNSDVFGQQQQPTEATAGINGGLSDRESMSWSASGTLKGLGQPFLSRSFFGILVEFTSSGGGEIGRRTSLRCWRPQGIGVQVPSSAPETPPEYPSRLGKQLRKCRFFFTSSLPFTCSCACS
jgi:hypothetical protein